jgi:tetratricopeptide (TPR) repeat protein
LPFQDLNAAADTDVSGDRGQGDRTLIEQALKTAQARLIIVYPNPSPQRLDCDLIDQFQAFLERGGCLDLGWGHLGDLHNRRQPRSIHTRRVIDATEQSYLHTVLHRLTALKQHYPDRFRFKVLGTDEDFLVCDRAYAVLGTQGLATASVVFPEATLGLRTRNPTVIQGLVDRFDQPVIADQDTVAYFNRATTRYDLGDRQGAIADYDEVLRITPSDDVTYNNRGLVRYDLGDKRGAMADFDLALQVNPGSFVAYCNRGVLRAELGDRVGAVEDYTTALTINPDYATAYFYRGLAQTKLQNRLGAIQDYSQVLRLNPQDATAYFYRGLACMKMGQRLEAIRDLRQAAQMFSEQGDTQNYQQVVDTLQKLHQRLGDAP